MAEVGPRGIRTRADLSAGLKKLRAQDGRSFDALAKSADTGAATIHAWTDGTSFPRWTTPRKLLSAYRITGPQLEGWRQAHGRAEAEEKTRPGRRLAEITDPFALDVHQPITADGKGDVAVLPPYVRRAHDDQVAEAVQRALGGHSAMVVLVAGSSTGKTRTLWEALEPLRAAGGWRLWHPLAPTPIQALLDRLKAVGPRTVLWLNETQDYLGNGIGEEHVAIALRSLLADRSRAPVLVLGTLWPSHHESLCRRISSQARRLLEDTVIAVPESFTGADLAAMRVAADSDPRLMTALAGAEDGRITQYVAGGPELINRYRFSCSPAARAIIDVAMDAVRLAPRNDVISRALLHDAARVSTVSLFSPPAARCCPHWRTFRSPQRRPVISPWPVISPSGVSAVASPPARRWLGRVGSCRLE
ncbi:hypothetical protein [Nocardia xishanensis]